jgi:hypothetical protein
MTDDAARRLADCAHGAFLRPCPVAAGGALDVTASEMAQPDRRQRCFPARRRPPFPAAPRDPAHATAAPEMSLRPVERDPWAAPRLRWDGHSQDMDWTLAAMAALRGPGASLVRTVPRDIADWCPGYEAAGRDSGGPSGRGWSRRSPGTKAPMTRGRGGRRRALVRAGADLAGDGALSGLPGDERAGAAGRGGEPALRSADHGGNGAARRRGVAGDARRGGRLGSVPFVAEARGHAAMAAGAGLLPAGCPRPCAADHAA